MANHTATKKSIRKTATVTAKNRSRKSRIKSFIVKVEAAVASGNKQEAQSAFKAAQPEIMKGVSKGVLKNGTASRKVSRLFAKIKAMA
jgi:small subunit ribosomal protein S20